MPKNPLELPVMGLSPMAGVTDFAFRRVCKEFGANYLVSEFISATALFYNPDKEKSLGLATFEEEQRPFFIQLFGRDPEHFKEAVKIVTGEKALPDGRRLKKPCGIDINFGCPAKKVIKNKSGCALYEEPETAREIVKAVLDSTDLPVSFKTRIGYKGIEALEFLDHLQDLPYHHLTMHARTFEQGHKGETDNEACKKVFDFVKSKFARKVIFNGGVKDVASYQKVMQETSADGVLIGHAALGNPWIFKSLQQGKDYRPTIEERVETVLKHAKYAIEDKSEYGLIEFRKHLSWYLKDFPGAKELRKKLIRVKTYQEIEEILNLG